MQIRVDLATSKKRDFPIAKFFCKIIGLTIDNTFLRDDEVLVYVLVGLLADYNTYFTSMMAKIEPLSLDNVFTHLIVFEAHQLQHVVELQLQHSASANYVGHRGTFCGRRGPSVVAPMAMLPPMVIVMSTTLVLSARSVAILATPPSSAGTGWTIHTKMNLQWPWRLWVL